jgi:hypothetical protein
MTSVEPMSLHVGPLGQLRTLPVLPIRGRHPAGHERIGGASTSLDGTTTLDVRAYRRTWAVDWTCLSADDWGWLEAWWLGLRRGVEHRIVDPRRPNRLTRDGSSGGSYSHTTDAHTVTAGTVGYVAVADYPTAIQLDGAVSWAVPAPGATLRVDDTPRIPLVDGEEVTVSVLLNDPGSVQVGARLYDVAGATTDDLSPAETHSGWVWRSHTFTPAGQVSASLAVVAAAGARTARVGPARWGEDTDWTPGSGCPAVLLTSFATTYPLGYYDVGIELREV